jgi:predicted phage terminase large subunit-like protein
MTREHLRHRVALQDALLTRRATDHLQAYVEQAWPILEPSTVFLPNWHIDLLVEYLEAVTAGELTRLVINVPPRYMKSLLVSTLWPTWEWIRAPETRWLCASYSESLSTKHSVDRRILLQSAWYQDRFGDRVRLTSDQNEKTEYRNSRGGVMVATSVGGSATGKGGNRIVVDDPHNPLQAESDAQRQHAVDFFLGTLTTRLDDKRRGAIVVVMQRLHQRDLTAVCQEHGHTVVRLPAECETPTTVVFPRSGRTVTRAVGDLLWPAREGAPEIAAQKAALGAFGFAGQYQQSPVPRSGGFFPPEWWRWFDTPPPGMQITQSWDLSFKGGDGHDFVVGLVAGRIGANVYLLDRYKAKVSFVDTCHAIRRTVARWPETRTVLVEDAANGPAVIAMLQSVVHGLIGVTPEGGKMARAAAVQPLIEAGQVWLPQYRLADGTVRHEHEWVNDFVVTCAAFPRGAHDDDVDALTQLLVRCRKMPTGVSTHEILDSMRDDDGDDDLDDPRHVEYRGFKPAPYR